MAIELPPSVRCQRIPIDREVEEARRMTPERRVAVVKQVWRATVKVLALDPHRDQILAARDPVPQSTVRALAPLRKRR